MNIDRVIKVGAALFVASFAVWFIFFSSNQDSAPMMYEDEMIVPIDDFTALQEAVITLQEGMKLLLAGEPQSPELTTEQSQFMCMQNTEDYKDGFLEISTILTCMNLQLTEQEQLMKNNKIKENQEQELDNIRHQIEVTKLQLELEQLKMKIKLPIIDVKSIMNNLNG